MNEDQSPSIILLLSEAFNIDEQKIRSALSKSFKSDFSVNADGKMILPVIENAQYMLWANGSSFILHNRQTGFFENVETIANSINGDDELSDKIKNHSAWFSIDVTGSNLAIAEQFDQIGMMLSEIAPNQTVAIFIPDKGVIMKFDSDRKSQLKGPNVLKKLGFNE